MNTQYTRKSPLVMMAAAGLVVGAISAASAAAPISVTVNGAPVTFEGTQPSEVSGSVLVPLRGVFEALGASVDYNVYSRTITAKKGLSTVVLPVGSTSATVNGQAQTLSQPAQAVNGTTLVPLRFVAQALGASVDWHAASSTVEIKTIDPHLASLPPAPTTSASGSVRGQLVGVYTDATSPKVTLRVNGETTTVPVSADTIVLRADPGKPAQQVALADIKIGDQVTIQRGDTGIATSITATYGVVRGTLKSIGKLASGNYVATLNDGTTVELVPDVIVGMDRRRMALSDVMPNEEVVIRTNPENNLGYALAVVTESNPHPVPSLPAGATGTTPGTVAVYVDTFSHDATRPLKAGDKVTANLKGIPGGKAFFAIPGVIEEVPMREVSPGSYTGDYIIPKNIGVTGAAVLGKLVANGATAPLRQASDLITIDSVPPHIQDFNPGKDTAIENSEPLIYANMSDSGGTGVDPNSFRVHLDGNDVSSQATVTPSFFNIKPAHPLAAGTHLVQVSVADLAGNTSAREWSFIVSNQKLVQSFATSASSAHAVTAGTDVQFTMAAEPGGKASFSVGNLARDVPMIEKSPGNYAGTYSVSQGDNIKDAPVTAKFISKNGTVVTQSLANGLTVAAGPPVAPKIISPQEGDPVNETTTVEGISAPNVTVRVKVDYVSKALGGILAVNGSAGSKEVTADKNGRWKVEGLSLKTNSLFGNDRDTTFTITAIAVSANGEESQPMSIRVRRG